MLQQTVIALVACVVTLHLFLSPAQRLIAPTADEILEAIQPLELSVEHLRAARLDADTLLDAKDRQVWWSVHVARSCFAGYEDWCDVFLELNSADQPWIVQELGRSRREWWTLMSRGAAFAWQSVSWIQSCTIELTNSLSRLSRMAGSGLMEHTSSLAKYYTTYSHTKCQMWLNSTSTPLYAPLSVLVPLYGTTDLYGMSCMLTDTFVMLTLIATTILMVMILRSAIASIVFRSRVQIASWFVEEHGFQPRILCASGLAIDPHHGVMMKVPIDGVTALVKVNPTMLLSSAFIGSGVVSPVQAVKRETPKQDFDLDEALVPGHPKIEAPMPSHQVVLCAGGARVGFATRVAFPMFGSNCMLTTRHELRSIRHSFKAEGKMVSSSGKQLSMDPKWPVVAEFDDTLLIEVPAHIWAALGVTCAKPAKAKVGRPYALHGLNALGRPCVSMGDLRHGKGLFHAEHSCSSEVGDSGAGLYDSVKDRIVAIHLGASAAEGLNRCFTLDPYMMGNESSTMTSESELWRERYDVDDDEVARERRQARRDEVDLNNQDDLRAEATMGNRVAQMRLRARLGNAEYSFVARDTSYVVEKDPTKVSNVPWSEIEDDNTWSHPLGGGTDESQGGTSKPADPAPEPGFPAAKEEQDLAGSTLLTGPPLLLLLGLEDTPSSPPTNLGPPSGPLVFGRWDVAMPSSPKTRNRKGKRQRSRKHGKKSPSSGATPTPHVVEELN